jgi:hypothetical protein
LFAAVRRWQVFQQAAYRDMARADATRPAAPSARPFWRDHCGRGVQFLHGTMICASFALRSLRTGAMVLNH